MRKLLATYLPASFVMALLAMALVACGGGGDGGDEATDAGTNSATLTGISIDGQATMNEHGTATYTATASWSDNSTSTVVPTWSVDSPVASMSPEGILCCHGIDNDEVVELTATYSFGGITKTAVAEVTISNTPTNPFTAYALSGAILFEENADAGGGYDSSLYVFNANSTFDQFNYRNPPDTSDRVNGSWTIDAAGKLILTVAGQSPVTVELIGDLIYVPMVLIDDGNGTPRILKWERSGPGPYPFSSSALPGTYLDGYGDTWLFDSDGTGSTTAEGGQSFTWSVDSGILKVVFSDGYEGWMYLRQTTQDSLASYTLLKWAFVEYMPTGAFYLYHGGMELARQGGGGNSRILTGLFIEGPSAMAENSSAVYSATAQWSDGSTSLVTATWSVGSQVVSISAFGVLSCQEDIASAQTVTITASYASGGHTETATRNVMITPLPFIPFTAQELSGKTFFEEHASRGGYSSSLYILNAGGSLAQYATFALPRGETSYYVTGAWTNDSNGLHLKRIFVDIGPATVQRLAESSMKIDVLFYDEIWKFYWFSTWEKTVPVDPAKLPGTYTGSGGEMWEFKADETGTSSIFGGITFTWSVDSEGVLRMPSTTGYSAIFYARATSLSTATEYTILNVAFSEHSTSTGRFHKYYGGYELTRQ